MLKMFSHTQIKRELKRVSRKKVLKRYIIRDKKARVHVKKKYERGGEPESSYIAEKLYETV